MSFSSLRISISRTRWQNYDISPVLFIFTANTCGSIDETMHFVSGLCLFTYQAKVRCEFVVTVMGTTACLFCGPLFRFAQPVDSLRNKCLHVIYLPCFRKPTQNTSNIRTFCSHLLIHLFINGFWLNLLFIDFPAKFLFKLKSMPCPIV